MGDILAEGVLVLFNVLSSVAEVEAHAIVPVVSIERSKFMPCVIILGFVFLLKSIQIFCLQLFACFALFLLNLIVQSFEFKLLVHGVVYSSGNDFNADWFFRINLHCSMEIGLTKARADIKESRTFALKAIVFNVKRQLFKFHLAFCVGTKNVFIDVLIDCQKCGKGTARYFTISKRRFIFILPGLTRF